MTSERSKLAAEEFAELYEREKELEAQLEETKAKRQNLEGAVVTQFAELGARRMRAGRYTVYLQAELRVSLANGESGGKAEAHAALREAGYGDLIEPRVMDRELTKLVKRFDEAEEELPAELAPWVQVYRGHTVRARRTGR